MFYAYFGPVESPHLQLSVQTPTIYLDHLYGYFAQRYELNIRSVHWEPDEIPTNEQMMELNRILKEHPAKWVIWEREPIKESTQRLQAVGIDSLMFDPCGNTPGQGDFLNVMHENVENLKSAFK